MTHKVHAELWDRFGPEPLCQKWAERYPETTDDNRKVTCAKCRKKLKLKPLSPSARGSHG